MARARRWKERRAHAVYSFYRPDPVERFLSGFYEALKRRIPPSYQMDVWARTKAIWKRRVGPATLQLLEAVGFDIDAAAAGAKPDGPAIFGRFLGLSRNGPWSPSGGLCLRAPY